MASSAIDVILHVEELKMEAFELGNLGREL
jgi:hypothetical protein